MTLNQMTHNNPYIEGVSSLDSSASLSFINTLDAVIFRLSTVYSPLSDHTSILLHQKPLNKHPTLNYVFL